MSFFSFELDATVLALIFVSGDLVVAILALVSTLGSVTFGLLTAGLALVSVLTYESVNLVTAFFGVSFDPPFSAMSIILRSVRSCL